jgi:hypothetical protein
VAFAPAVYPVPNRFINVGKEAQPGSVASGTYTFPVTTFKPVDKYDRLEDNAWRNAMARLYNLIGGVRIADMSIGGPFFGDGIGYVLANAMGDYWQAVAGGTTAVGTSLSGSVSVGATTIVVGSTAVAVNAVVSIGAVGSTAEEVRKVTSSAGGTLTLNAALYQGHATGGTVISYSGYTAIQHNFALLNPGSLGAGGWTSSQPPTYTYEDYTGVSASTGARVYSYSCFSEVTISGEAQALVEWDGKITALASQIAATTPTTSLSGVAPQPSWVSTVAINGAGTQNNASWKLTLTRKLEPKFTNQGTQDPYAIPRSYLEAMIAFDWDPASDEQEFLYYLNNVQPSCQIVASNNLSGTANVTLTVNAQQIGFTDGALEDGKEVFGYSESAKCIANTTNTGPSGGFSPVSVSVTNQVISY